MTEGVPPVEPELTLYFAVTYTIQRFILQAKAQRIADGPYQDVGDPGTRAPSW